MSETPDNAHQLAAEKHAKKRAADRVKRAAKATKGKGKPSKSNRVKSMPLERSPNPELTAVQRMTMTNDQIASMTPTKKQRFEVSQDKLWDLEADTAASLARESAPTPLEQQRQAYSAEKLAALQARSEQRKDRHKQD
jgi:hypothetical protein